MLPQNPQGNNWKDILKQLLDTNIHNDQTQLLEQQVRVKLITEFNFTMRKAQRLLYQFCQAQRKKVLDLQLIIQSLKQQLVISKDHIEIQNKHIETLNGLVYALENDKKKIPKLDQLQTAESILLNNKLTVLDLQFQNQLNNQGQSQETFLFSEIYKHPEIIISDDGTSICSISHNEFDVFATINYRQLDLNQANIDTLKFCCCQPYISSTDRIDLYFEIKEMGEKISIGIGNEGFMNQLNGGISEINEYYLIDQNGIFYLKNLELGEYQINSTQFQLRKSDVLKIQIDIQNGKISWTKNPDDENQKENNIIFDVQIKQRMYPIIGIQKGQIDVLGGKRRAIHY